MVEASEKAVSNQVQTLAEITKDLEKNDVPSPRTKQRQVAQRFSVHSQNKNVMNSQERPLSIKSNFLFDLWSPRGKERDKRQLETSETITNVDSQIAPQKGEKVGGTFFQNPLFMFQGKTPNESNEMANASIPSSLEKTGRNFFSFSSPRNKDGLTSNPIQSVATDTPVDT